MSNVWSQKADSVLRVGRPLDEIGIRNWALTRSQALNAINELESAGIAILGGDVYYVSDNRLSSSPDSWYCDQSPNQPWNAFVRRSATEARKYIEGYEIEEESDVLFAIVPRERNVVEQ